METVNICKLFVMLLRRHRKHYGSNRAKNFQAFPIKPERHDSTNKRDNWKIYNAYIYLMYEEPEKMRWGE